jgi:hypothetical protein
MPFPSPCEVGGFIFFELTEVLFFKPEPDSDPLQQRASCPFHEFPQEPY